MIDRKVRSQIVAALSDTRVVMVLGARQVGKSTLTEKIARAAHPAQILSFDNTAVRQAATEDAKRCGRVRSLGAATLEDDEDDGYGP